MLRSSSKTESAVLQIALGLLVPVVAADMMDICCADTDVGL